MRSSYAPAEPPPEPPLLADVEPLLALRSLGEPSPHDAVDMSDVLSHSGVSLGGLSTAIAAALTLEPLPSSSASGVPPLPLPAAPPSDFGVDESQLLPHAHHEPDPADELGLGAQGSAFEAAPRRWACAPVARLLLLLQRDGERLRVWKRVRRGTERERDGEGASAWTHLEWLEAELAEPALPSRLLPTRSPLAITIGDEMLLLLLAALLPARGW